MNSIGCYPGYLSGHIFWHALTSFCTSSTPEMDELAVGYEFADFESLLTAVTNF